MCVIDVPNATIRITHLSMSPPHYKAVLFWSIHFWWPYEVFVCGKETETKNGSGIVDCNSVSLSIYYLYEQSV